MTKIKPCKRCYGAGVEPNWKRLGRELRRRRVAADVSLRVAAKEAGLSAAHLSNVERGLTPAGGPKVARVLARFGLTVDHAFPKGEAAS